MKGSKPFKSLRDRSGPMSDRFEDNPMMPMSMLLEGDRNCEAQLERHIEAGTRGGGPESCTRELLHDVEHHERRNAGGVRRQLRSGPAAIGCADGSEPFGLVLGQVGGRHRSSQLLRDLKNGASRLAFVKAVPPFVRNQPQRFRQVGVFENLRPSSARGHRSGRSRRVRKLLEFVQ